MQDKPRPDQSESPQREIKRRNSIKGAQRREAILQAGIRHFAINGFQNTAIAAVAEDVGLSLPGLLHYYPTKVDLLLAILQRRDEESTPQGWIEKANWRDLLQLLVVINKRNTGLQGVVRAFSILNAESLQDDHPAQSWFHKRTVQLRERIATLLIKGVENGEIIETINVQALASEIISMMDGLQIMWLRLPETTDMDTIFANYIERLIASIEKTKQET